MTYDIPILLVFFNRKEILLKTFEQIKRVKPSVLYLAQDGPRSEKGIQESIIVDDVRNTILKNIDWKCDLHTLFRKENLGCAMGVKTAIDWMFEKEDYGIIIEDDCVVSESFFAYMKQMLLTYKNDQRIGMIAGTNPISTYKPETSFIFSRFKSCWGWATWARAWKNMDMQMKWRTNNLMSVINNSGFNGKHNSKWLFQLDYIDKGYVSAWDWQWYFSLSSQNQLCIYPAVNLVSNIGNDAEATHTAFSGITLNREELLFPLKSPTIVAPDYQFDKAFDKNENKMTTRIARCLPYAVKSFIKRLLKR